VEKIEDIAEHAVLGRANLENLKKAGLSDCVGLIAGTDNDTFNLSMVHQANRENDSLFSIVRQNKHSNEVLFKKADVDYIQPSLVIARMVLFMLTAPLLKSFFAHLRLLYENDPSRLADIMNRLALEVGGNFPALRTYTINKKETSAVYAKLFENESVDLGDIYRDPANRDVFLKMVPLVHRRGKVIKVLPADNLPLREGDELLFCMRPKHRVLLEANLANRYTLDYLLTGKDLVRSDFFKWLRAKA